MLVCFVPKQLKKFRQDHAGVGFGSATSGVEQAIEKTTANMKWVTENRAHVMQWLLEESV